LITIKVHYLRAAHCGVAGASEGSDQMTAVFQTKEGTPPMTQETITADQNAKLVRAKRRVAALKGFYIHFFAFVVVLVVLGVINVAVGPPWWVLWVLLGWGVGVLAHGLGVLGQTSQRIAGWEQRKIQKLMEQK
jgi:hypothetical protein